MLTVGAARLEMRIDARDGTGNWDLRAGRELKMYGAFALLPEGRIELDGVETEMDHAAIDMIALLTREAEGPVGRRS